MNSSQRAVNALWLGSKGKTQSDLRKGQWGNGPRTWPPTSSGRGCVAPVQCKEETSEQPGLHPGPSLGSLQLSPDPTAGGEETVCPSPETPEPLSALLASAIAPGTK